MLAFRNATPYAAVPVVLCDRDGRDVIIVVAKATFRWTAGGVVTPAAEPVPLSLSDQYHGEPGKSSLKLANDFSLFKPAADVAVLGKAYAPGGRAVTQMTVEVSVGPARKKILVVGDRKWRKGVMGVSPGEPASFLEMPLVYERAFGGKYPLDKPADALAQEDRNPVGVGFWGSAAQAADKPMPNLEDPAKPIQRLSDRPAPQGLGFLAGDWQPRRQLAGTYDAKWQETRMPLLPGDFDYAYFNAAPPELRVPGYLKGGEEVKLVGLSRRGDVAFRLPSEAIDVKVLLPRDEVQSHVAVCDTLILEPDEERLQLVWRAKIVAPEPLTLVRLIEVQCRSRAAAGKAPAPAKELAHARR